MYMLSLSYDFLATHFDPIELMWFIYPPTGGNLQSHGYFNDSEVIRV